MRPAPPRLFRAAALAAALAAGPVSGEDPLRVVAFGSCAHQSRSQAFWQPLLDAKPDLFVFAGDNIYADTEDMGRMRQKYGMLQGQPGFKSLSELCPVLATWDDHDYGRNDAGAEYPMKKESRDIFFEVFGVPADSPRRAHEGVYDGAVCGPEGRRVQVILLDTRWSRSPLARVEPGSVREGHYRPSDDPEARVLGEAQWAWLEARLREPAEVRLLVSSIQVVSCEHAWETWGNFPRERARLFDVIRRSGAAGVVILSGDRHHAELSCVRDAVGYPLFDLTASGLNMARGRAVEEPNRHRLAGPFPQNHFGVVRLDWDRPEPALRLQILDLSGREVIGQDVPVGSLKPPP
jgi:alkaline phosphatase D